MRLLTLQELLDAYQEFEGHEAPIRDLGALEAAVHRQNAVVFGHDLYPTLDLKVAALVDSIARGHPLIDGNKRLSFVAARLTYFFNSRPELAPSREDIYALFLNIADAHLEIPDMAEEFEKVFVAKKSTETDQSPAL